MAVFSYRGRQVDKGVVGNITDVQFMAETLMMQNYSNRNNTSKCEA